MFARRLGVWALLAGIAGLGRPGAAAAQSGGLPLRAARALMIVDAWEGLSPVSPARATYTLRRLANGSFTGSVQISVGSGLVRRDTAFAVQLPRAAVDSLLQVLSRVPLQGGSYLPTLTHTDDYPSITVELTVGDSVVRFHTTSQGEAHVPWEVSAAGRTYVSASEAIWPALAAVLGRIGRGEQQAIIEAARNDPEARCSRGFSGSGAQPAPAQRPRYAGGEAWFAQDSTITVQGRDYRKYGLPRTVGLQEISAYATYRGVAIFREAGSAGTPQHVYVPVIASCEVQPYALEPQP